VPLKPGHSRKTIGKNIGEMLDAYKEKGKIGNARPKNMAHAQKIAAAAAYDKAGKKKGKKK
jgi:hypothetical protein